jgi:hypothetical protein
VGAVARPLESLSSPLFSSASSSMEIHPLDRTHFPELRGLLDVVRTHPPSSPSRAFSSSFRWYAGGARLQASLLAAKDAQPVQLCATTCGHIAVALGGAKNPKMQHPIQCQ